MSNELYWSFNIPLQVWPKDSEDPDSETEVLNYMPRKERVDRITLEDAMGDQTREEFFETAAIHFENMARLFREAKNDESKVIYYHDEGMGK